jgi:hypothetical protein
LPGSNLQGLLAGLLAAEDVSLGARLALESVGTLFAAGETTTLALELVHADGGQGGGAVVLGSVVMDFVDGDGSVDDLMGT